MVYKPNRPSRPTASPWIPPTAPLRTSSIRYRLPNLSIVEDSNARVLRLRQELAECLRLFGAALAIDMTLRELPDISVMPSINEELHTAVQSPNHSAVSLASTQSDTTSRRSLLALERQNINVVDDVPVDPTALPEPLFSRPCRHDWCGVCHVLDFEDARSSLQLRRVAVTEESFATEETYEKSTGVTYSAKECRTRRCFRRIQNAAKRLMRR